METLSDKKFKSKCGWEVITFEDVKEFIKQLKADLKIVEKDFEKKDGLHQFASGVLEAIPKLIDKRAGDKLI